MDNLERSLGNLQGRVAAIERRNEAVDAKLDEILRVLNQSRGGVRMMLTLGSAAAGIGALVASIMHFWSR